MFRFVRGSAGDWVYEAVFRYVSLTLWIPCLYLQGFCSIQIFFFLSEMGINGEIVLLCLCYEQRNNPNFWAICKQMQRICTAVLFAVILTDLFIYCRCAHWRWSAVGTAQLVLVCSLIVQAVLHDGSTTVWSLPHYWDKGLWHQPAPVCDPLLSICTAHVGNCSIFVLQKAG